MQKKYKQNPRTVVHYLSFTLAVWLSLFSILGGFSIAFSESDAVAALARESVTLIPGGMTFGVNMETRGVLVVGVSKGSASEEAGIKRGDVLLSLDGKTVENAQALIARIEASSGRVLRVTLERNGKTVEKNLTAKPDDGGKYRAGLRVRDSTAGIGTVTAIDPETLSFIGLGHGICDSDTGVLMPLREGRVYDVTISSIRKGASGAPGEIQGYFSSGECGVLLQNTRVGVSGKMSGKRFNDIKPISVAKRNEVTLGEATVICTVSDAGRQAYRVRIVKLTSPNGEDKNFVIEVTDPKLLDLTGGIVQGMSGSPIIQNGKLVGAVTHVMVNDPTRGYGIFIDNMLANMASPLQSAA